MPASSRDMNIPVLTTLFAMGTVLVYVIVVATQAWFRYEVNRELETKVINQTGLEIDRIRAEQVVALNSGVRPIDDAKQAAVAFYASQAPAGR